MISQETFYGGAIRIASGTNITIKTGYPRIIVVDPSANIDVTLPNPLDHQSHHKGKSWYIINADLVFNLIIKNHLGGTLTACNNEEAVVIHLAWLTGSSLYYLSGDRKAVGWNSNPL
jgi:hypothetical protein